MIPSNNTRCMVLNFTERERERERVGGGGGGEERRGVIRHIELLLL